MRRLLVLIGLAACVGCAQDKGSWAEAMKDLRGDNMQMRSAGWAPTDEFPREKPHP
jgi:hypothetical protein